MSSFDTAAGTVRLELISADIVGSLRDINEMRIPVYDLQISGELSATFSIPWTALKRVQAAADRKGERTRVLSQKGINYMILSILSRKVLLFGLAILLVFALYLPSRVLFVEVEGNSNVSTDLILEAAKEAGLRFFASRREVRSEKMKNELLSKLPQLKWAGVNTYGCTAVISVRERSMEMQSTENSGTSRMIAACDGVITSCTVTEGSVVCDVGQAVRKGQVLVSGYTDCGGVIIAGRASGEIFAQTRHEISVAAPSRSKLRAESKEKQTLFSLRIGKKRINFYKGSGISDSRCDKMVEEYKLTLPGGYVLPIAFLKERYEFSEFWDNSLVDDSLALSLSEFGRELLKQSSVALAIVDSQVKLSSSTDLVVLSGIYSCTEMIAREQSEQIGDFYGKTS